MQTNNITNSSYPAPILPTIAELDLNSGDFFIPAGVSGIIYVKNGSDGGFGLYFPDPKLSINQRLIVINQDNLDYLDANLLGDYVPFAEATNSTINSIPPGITYNFVSDNNNWRSIPDKKPGIGLINASIGSIGGYYSIEKPGSYSIKTGIDDAGIVLPRAANYNGETITIFNVSNDLCDTVTIDDIPEIITLDNNYVNNFNISSYSAISFISIDGFWRIFSYNVG